MTCPDTRAKPAYDAVKSTDALAIKRALGSSDLRRRTFLNAIEKHRFLFLLLARPRHNHDTVEMMRLLLDNGCQADRMLFDKGGDRPFWILPDGHASTLLHWAAETCENPELIQLLVQHGARVDGRASTGLECRTPLHSAVIADHPCNTRALLERGPTRGCATPLIIRRCGRPPTWAARNASPCSSPSRASTSTRPTAT
eukprot:TRINITY_DN14550_c0_g1_i1.p2 TRINITY_DN14550_c0_g1~~TRINITY_DN14550_c0_g1_i1.p2  ORF type:complete len:199 (-),score=44.04 TRINITY_DN14550_c0_g1_i1:300-896(-)